MELNRQKPSAPCILFALDRESFAFRRLYPPRQKCTGGPGKAWYCSGRDPEKTMFVMLTGVGPERTQQALEWILQRSENPPSLLVMAGYAGALQEKLRVGDILLASEILDLKGNSWPTSWPEVRDSQETSWYTGRLLSCPHFISDPEEKQRLGQIHQVYAADMEAATVARFCTQHRIPFGCIRAISDDVHTALDKRIGPLVAGGQVAYGRLAWTLLRFPWLIFELCTLAKNTRLASRRLAEALDILLCQDG